MKRPLMLVAACSLASALWAAPRPPASLPGALAGRYAGELPGANSRIRVQLELLPDGRYQLRRSYLDKPAPDQGFDEIGRWRYEGQPRRLRLSEGPQFFERSGRDLRQLDREGRRIASASGHNSLLKRVPKAEPLEPRLRLTGLFTYQADAPRIALCANGQSLPVAQEADYLALERAYTQAGAQGQALRVELDGWITRRVGGEESQGLKPALVVERFQRLLPGLDCADPLPAAASTPPAPPLRGTPWQLVQLGTSAVDTPADAVAPHLVFDVAQAQVAGSGGCNRLVGGVEIDGARLRFLGLASTRMACEPERMAREQAFGAALARVSAWRQQGQRLELLDADAQPLLVLQAQPR